MNLLLVISIFFGFLQQSKPNELLFLDPKILTKRISELVELALNREEIQDHFDSLTYTDSKLDKSGTDKVVESIDQKFQEIIKAVRNLKQTAEASYTVTGSREGEDCCWSKDLAYVSKYRTQVNDKNGCFLSSNPSSSSFFPVEDFTRVCKENAANFSSIKWQYFATNHALTYRYPKTQSFCKFQRNPFQKSWYFHAFVPQQIQMVIVVDTSSSMANRADGIPILSLVVDAVKSIISPLGLHDQFAVIAASENTQGFGGNSQRSDCFSDTFAQATATNKQRMTEILNNLQARGRTFYKDALVKAFGYFSNERKSTAENNIDKIILFVTNGKPEDPPANVSDAFQIENTKLNSSVRIFTYGLGSENFSLLQNLASLNSVPSKSGVFTAVPDPTKILSEMPDYYLHLSTPDTGEPIWTAPYLDTGKLGQIITASLPVFVNTTAIGVVATDVRLDDLVLISHYFQPSELSYSFIINGKGLIIHHPFFPSGIRTPINLVDATTLEQDDEFQSVLESMKRGESGNKTFNSTKFIKHEVEPHNDVQRIKVLSQYIWKKVNQSDFSICLVIALNDPTIQISSQDPFPPDTFLHIRTDLIPPREPCKHFTILSSFNQSTTFFATRAFNNPNDYIASNYTREDIESIRMYLEGTGPNEFNIKEQAKQEAIATFKAEELWKASGVQPWLRHVAWRFMATKNGVFRSLPAGGLPKFFDPTVRPWYADAKANPDKYIVNIPHSNGLFHDYDLSRAILEAGDTSQKKREVVGAVGAAILVEFFRGIIQNLYSDFTDSPDYKFYLINTVGYLIVSEVPLRKNEVKQLIEEEPEIASVLISSNILQRVSCTRVDIGKVQRQYEIKMSSSESAFLGFIKGDGKSCNVFSLTPVPETNLVILLLSLINVDCGNISFASNSACTCSGDPKRSRTCTTSWDGNDGCECPCLEPSPYINQCKSTFELANASSPLSPCLPASFLDSDTDRSVVVTRTVPDLEICYELFLGLESDNTYSTIVLSVSISVFTVGFLITATAIYFRLKSLEAKARIRAKQTAAGVLRSKISQVTLSSKRSVLSTPPLENRAKSISTAPRTSQKANIEHLGLLQITGQH